MTAARKWATGQLIIPNNCIQLLDDFLVKILEQMVLEEVLGLQCDVLEPRIFECRHRAWGDGVEKGCQVARVDNKACNNMLTYL